MTLIQDFEKERLHILSKLLDCLFILAQTVRMVHLNLNGFCQLLHYEALLISFLLNLWFN